MNITEQKIEKALEMILNTDKEILNQHKDILKRVLNDIANTAISEVKGHVMELMTNEHRKFL